MKQTTRSSIQNLCISALLLATGLLLPFVFHMVGGPATGGMLLPMHLPVLLGGLLLGPFYGALVGAFTPLMSFLLTGMPTAAKLPFMILELVSYGAISGFLQVKKQNLYLSLVCAQIGGRLVNAAALFAALYLLHLNVPPAATLVSALVTGLPGIAVQLLLIPILVRLLRKVIHVDRYSEG